MKRLSPRAFVFFVLPILAVIFGAASSLLGACGPFTDVSEPMFCPLVLEVFYLGITTGTTPTTYSPEQNVNRLQMAAFLSRAVDGTLKRGSRRAALGQFWTHSRAQSLSLTTIASVPWSNASDGQDIWISHAGSTPGVVSRVRASDGRLLETWTGGNKLRGIVAAMGRVFVVGSVNDTGKLYSIDPSQPAGTLVEVASGLGREAWGIAFDGDRIWTTAEFYTGKSVSIVTPGPSLPWTVTTITTGFVSPWGLVFDGAHIWMTDEQAGTLLKLDNDGAILQTVTIGADARPQFPAFDGQNIWVPNAQAFTTAVIRASTGTLLANLAGNGQNGPGVAAFDGERVLVSGVAGYQGFVSLWKAADLTPLGHVDLLSVYPLGACSDGVNFWVNFRTEDGHGRLARF